MRKLHNRRPVDLWITFRAKAVRPKLMSALVPFDAANSVHRAGGDPAPLFFLAHDLSAPACVALLRPGCLADGKPAG